MATLSGAAILGDLKHVEHLVQQGCDINALDVEDMTPVQHAAEAAKWDVVRYLVVHGAALNTPDGDGRTVLQRAVEAGEWDMVRYLTSMGGDVNVLDGAEVSPVGNAVRNGEWGVAKYMVEKGGRIDDLTCEQKEELLEKVIGKTIAFDDVDGVHRAFYNVIRLGNTELFEMLIQQTGLDNDNTNTARKLDNILAKTYQELHIRNVPLSPEVKFVIENKLIGLRFFSDKTEINETTVQSSLDDVKKRIEMVCSQIGELSQKYSGADGKEVDGKFMLVGRFVAQNVRVLKRQLRSTYQKLPWEEIEFCLAMFISPHRRQTIDSLYNLVLDKERLLTYLREFGEKLNEEKLILREEDVNSKFPLKLDQNVSARDDAVKSVLSHTPSFQDLYNDHELIRSVHSLNRMESYIELALSIDLDEGNKDWGRLVIERTLQVIGESLKNTLESPNVSEDIHRMLLYSAPSNVREIVTELRDSLSHAHTLKKRIALEDDQDSKFFHDIQKDLRKIEVEITDILYKKDTEAIVTFLNKLIACDSILEIKKLSNSLMGADFKNVRFENNNTSELRKTKELIEELNIELRDEKGFENDLELLTLMRKIVSSQEKRSRNVKLGFSMGLDAIRITIGQALHNMSYDIDDIRNMSFTFLKILEPKMPAEPSKAMLTYVEQLNISVEQKMEPNSKLDRIKSVLYKIKCIVEFEASRVKGLHTFKKSLEMEESVSNRAAMEKMKVIFDEIEENLVNDKDRNVFKEILKDKMGKYKAKENLKALFHDLSEGLVSNERHVIKKFQDLVTELEVKAQKSQELTESFNNAQWIECNRIIDGLGDKYQVLLNSVKNSLGSEKSPDLSSSFKRFFSTKKLNPIIDNILKTNTDQFQSYYEKRLIKLDQLLSTGSTFELVTKHENDKKFQLIVDMLVLDLSDILEHTSLFGDNSLFLDGLSPLLVGKSLRNYLAHGDAFADSLPCSTSAATISTARLLIKATKDLVIKKNVLVGQRIEGEIENRNELYNKSLDLIHNKIEMFVACKEGNLKRVKHCLEIGVDIYSRDTNGRTGIHYAAQGDSVDVLKYFLDNIHLGVDIEDLNSENALHIAAKFKSDNIIKYLVENNLVDVNSVDHAKKTLLHHVAEVGASGEVVKVMLDKGALVEVKDEDGLSPLHFSALGGQRDIALALLDNGADADARDATDSTPLHLATFRGHASVIAALLDHGATVDARDRDDWTPLHSAAINGRGDVAAKLLAHGAHVDARDLADRTPLHVATFGGKVHVMGELIDKGANINAANINGMTPIHLAVQFGQKDAAIILLNLGADINVLNKDRNSPLHSAVFGGHIDVVQTLLATSFAVDADQTQPETGVADIDILDANECTPLYMAAKFGYRDIVEELLKSGANIEADDDDGVTPLQIAALEGHADVVEVLLDAGASVEARTRDGSSSLHSAAYSGRRDIVLALLKSGSQVDDRDEISFTPLHMAVKRGNLEVAVVLMDSGADVNALGKDQSTPLHLAAKFGQKAATETLISHGADIGALLADDSTPLHVSAYFGHPHVARVLLKHDVTAVDLVKSDGMRALHLAAQNGYAEVAAVLLDKDADVNAEGKDSRTPLHLAAQNGHHDVAVLLMDTAAEVNAVDKIKATPLHLAVEKGHIQVTEALLANKADVNAANVNGIRPLHVAVFTGSKDLTAMLLGHGAVVDVLDKDDRTPLHFAAFAGREAAARVLLDHAGEVDPKDSDDTTPLLMAVEYGNEGVAMLLMGRGADVRVVGVDDRTPLHLAARVGQSGVVTALLDRGAEIDALDKDAATPLHEAAREGCAEVAQVLLARGAAVDPRTKDDVTPLHLAVEQRHRDVVLVLLEAGADFLAMNNHDTVLHRAVNGDDEEILLAILQKIRETFHNAEGMYNSINASDAESDTPFMRAAEKGQVTATKLLLEFGADVDAVNDAGVTALHYAADHGHLDIVNLLVGHRADVHVRDADGNTPYDLARRSSRDVADHETYDVIMAVLQKGHSIPARLKAYNMALIQVAALNGNLNAVLHFLEEGTDVEFRDERDMTPLLFSAKNGHRDVVNALLESGADVNARNIEEWTPLMFATHGGHGDIVNDLLQHEADVNAQDTLKVTSLHIATLVGREDIVESLLKHGAKIDTRTNEKLTALHLASELGNVDIVEILLNHGANFEEQGKDDMRPLHYAAENCHRHLVEVLLEKGVNTEARARDNWTALHYAAANGHENVAEVLLKSGANVHSRAKDGMRVLHCAAANGHAEVVRVLLASGADVGAIARDDKTPLHYSASNGRKVVLNLLIDQGADVNARTKEGMTPLHFASYYGHTDVVATLLSRGADIQIRERHQDTAEDLANKQGHSEVISLLHTFKTEQESKMI